MFSFSFSYFLRHCCHISSIITLKLVYFLCYVVTFSLQGLPTEKEISTFYVPQICVKMKSYCTCGCRAFSKYTVNPLLNGGGGGGGLIISNTFEVGLIETGGLFNLEKTMVSVVHKEVEYKVKKLKYKKLEVMQPRIKNKSDLPVGE